MKKSKSIIALTIFCLAFAVISRLVEHPANFAPIAAIALVAAYYLASKYSWMIPLGAMLIADLFIGFYDWQVMVAVYASFLLIWGLGRAARSAKTRWALLPATLFGAILHFLVTNFAVWLFTAMYAKTTAGLILAYTMGIPFFKWTLAGDVFYMIIFVSAIELSRYAVKSLAKKEAITQQTFYNS